MCLIVILTSFLIVGMVDVLFAEISKYIFNIQHIGVVQDIEQLSNVNLFNKIFFVVAWLALIGDGMEKTGHLLKSAEDRGELQDFDS